MPEDRLPERPYAPGDPYIEPSWQRWRRFKNRQHATGEDSPDELFRLFMLLELDELRLQMARVRRGLTRATEGGQ